MAKKEDIRSKYNFFPELDSIICTDEYGFIMDQFVTKCGTEEDIRLKYEWFDLLKKYEFNLKKFKRSAVRRNLLARGIPLSLKYRVWSKLVPREDCNYERYRVQPSPCEYQIHVDVQRTCRFHFLFNRTYGKGQCELFNVLVAISNYKSNVGYCQGMSDIAAIILMYFCEKEAFSFWIALMEKNNLDGLFDKNLSLLPHITGPQNAIFSICIPEIRFHLEQNQIDFTMTGIGWYMTFFARFPIRLTLKIWDYLMFYGFNILIYFSGAILKCFEPELLERKSEVLLEYLAQIDQKEINEELVVDMVQAFVKKSKGVFIDEL